jgi:tetratricopeptide (TPR) repeat protein
LTLARCEEALGPPEQAQAYYQAALAAAPDDPTALYHVARFYLHSDQSSRARPILRALLNGQTQSPPDLAAWALRELALELAAEGTEASWREALTLLDGPARAGSVADQRASALVLGTRPEHRREALRTIEDTISRQPLTSEEQFRLAQLYEADNDRPKARELMLSLLANHVHESRFLAAHVQALLARAELTEARHWLDRLEMMEPGSARTKALRAELARQSARQ